MTRLLLSTTLAILVSTGVATAQGWGFLQAQQQDYDNQQLSNQLRLQNEQFQDYARQQELDQTRRDAQVYSCRRGGRC